MQDKVHPQDQAEPSFVDHPNGNIIQTNVFYPIYGDTVQVGPTHTKKYKLTDIPKQTGINHQKNKLQSPPKLNLQLTESDIETQWHVEELTQLDNRIAVIHHQKPQIAGNPDKKGDALKHIQFYGIEQGLMSTRLKQVETDKQGNLWIATDNSGLIHFDGEFFTNYAFEDGLPSNDISDILVATNGDVWISSLDDGFVKLSGDSIHYYTELEGLPKGKIWNLSEDKNGNIYIAYLLEGFLKYDGTSFYHYTGLDSLRNNSVKRDISVSSIIIDSRDRMWIGTWGDGVYIIEDNKCSILSTNEGLSHATVNAILEDNDGRIWIFTWGGIAVVDGNEMMRYTRDEGLPSSQLRAAHIDLAGAIWMSFSNAGISKIVEDHLESFTLDDGLTSNNVFGFEDDEHGNMWLASSSGGLNVIKVQTIKQLTKKSGLPSNAISSVFRDKSENVWLTTAMGLCKVSEDSILIIDQTSGLVSNNLLSIGKDGDRLWLGTGTKGLVQFDGSSFTEFDKSIGLSKQRIRSIAVDQSGNSWFATYFSGLSKYDGEIITQYTVESGLLSGQLFEVIVDSQNKIWAGSKNGLLQIKGDSIKYFTTNEGLPHNRVYSVLERKNGEIWAGTHNGISIYNGHDWQSFTSKDGIKGKSVTSLIEDQNEGIWFSTYQSINQIIDVSTSAENRWINIKTYGIQDGVSSFDFTTNIAEVDDKNNTWWASKNGITIIQNQLKSDIAKSIYEMSITGIEINNSLIQFGTPDFEWANKIDFVPDHEFRSIPSHLDLDYDNNNVKFYFSANDIANPHQIKYEYILKGFEENWQSPQSEPFTDYKNMQPGEYTFNVRASSYNVPESTIASIEIHIKPPWWKSLLAYIIYTILFVGGLALIIRQRSKYLVNRNKRLQTLVDEQTEELKESFQQLEKAQSKLIQSEKMASLGQLSAGIAHEINNPINYISNSTEALKLDIHDLMNILSTLETDNGTITEKHIQLFLKKKNELNFSYVKNELNELLTNITSGTDRVAGLIQSMKYLSYPDKLEKEVCDVHAIIESSIDILNPKWKNKVSWIKKYASEAKIIGFPGQLNQVFVNILDNAIDAIQKSGTIELRTMQTENVITIIIEDTGRGIAVEKLVKVFDPFYTDKDIGKGTGLGLAISYGIIQNHNGDIFVTSQLGKGTQVKISLPIEMK